MRSCRLIGTEQLQALAPGPHRGLLVYRSAVVGAAADAGVGERGCKTIGFAVAHDIKMPCRCRAERRARQRDELAELRLRVVRGGTTTPVRPVVEVGKLHAQD